MTQSSQQSFERIARTQQRRSRSAWAGAALLAAAGTLLWAWAVTSVAAPVGAAVRSLERPAAVERAPLARIAPPGCAC